MSILSARNPDRFKQKTLFFHGTDMNSLHKHIDPKFLPESYGGTRPEFHYAEWFRKLTKNKAVVEAMTELGYKTEYNENNSDDPSKDNGE